MIIDVTMPQLGESVSEGTVTKWLVREGDVVKKDQPLLEIATDKADSELPAPAAGRVTKLFANEGDVVSVKAMICQIDDSATASAGSADSGASRASSREPAPPPAASAGDGGSRSASSGPSGGGGSSLASPGARKAALENDVNLDNVRGSGEYGRIGRDDVLRASAGSAPPQASPSPPPARMAGTLAAVPAAAKPAAQQLAQIINQSGGFTPPIPGAGFGAFKVPSYRANEGDKVIPFTRRRRITADHMTYSKFASPHVVTVAEIDLQKSSRLREANKDRYKKEGLSLTLLAFAVVAAARALRETPDLNARVLDDSYVIFKDINIGVAVDSPDGLVVPVVRRADELGVRGIVRSIDDLVKRARTGKITIDDLSGATFSITNPGIKGNLFGGAIINQPNVGILRMGEIQKRVVVVEGPDGEDHMAIHPVMYMALSYDHRIVDGVAANSFLWRVTEILEKGDFEV
jgi:2-oxoglutarate dehydrogenase E2 component (dihydrolipoamide succinyltransferase)